MIDIDDSLPEFPQWLRRRLNRRGWSPADLARESGIHPQTISKWLNGKSSPRKPELIHRLATSLDVHQDEVLEILDMRDSAANHMSLAVRRLAPVIDSYEWDEVKLETAERLIRSIGEMYQGRFPTPSVEE